MLKHLFDAGVVLARHRASDSQHAASSLPATSPHHTFRPAADVSIATGYGFHCFETASC
ncbi:hypothetical protein SH661x_000751 [Planctomicrobium sp. SH661]|uniref:hypothetical protein n=1 Tax=Planctomicrobium sp. SH661 TaxID=3448124 RepID=UPI003F5B301C